MKKYVFNTVESLTLDRAYKLIVGIKNRQADKLLETSLRQSRHSRRSKSSTSTTPSSAARVKALAEAVAARESAELNFEVEFIVLPRFLLQFSH